MRRFQKRVIKEKQELDNRLLRLKTFMGLGAYSKLPEAEQIRLLRQSNIMRAYSQVLEERITAFER